MIDNSSGNNYSSTCRHWELQGYYYLFDDGVQLEMNFSMCRVVMVS
jgi:hypothetical protein